MEVINRVIEYWVSQGIIIEKNSIDKIEVNMSIKKFLLPAEFIEFYLNVNGMSNLYPNYSDKEGFLFYPIEALCTIGNDLSKDFDDNLNGVIVFADYLVDCWSYGLRILNDEMYQIGLIANNNTFEFITNSLGEFLTLYMEDSDQLY